jgi:7-cyano-7-deazaguanine reductase
MTKNISDSPLGQQTQYVSVYSPELLFPIQRQLSRHTLSLSNGNLPFYGVDIWTGYELSWLDERGKPEVAVAEFHIPCISPCIIESKSFKLYLNSFNQTRLKSIEQVREMLIQDLSRAAGASVVVNIASVTERESITEKLDGICLDDLAVNINTYHPAPELLSIDASSSVKEVLVSHLLKSNCPVTGQPDWASVQVSYAGARINHENLLRYIISFREHQDFHEHCVERMFVDIMQRCQPSSLSVYARYTRRGGLDINPFRTSEVNHLPKPVRLVRQ